ncbi:MAG: hypothetical protein IJ333_09480 [Clostridia bacterium]|nr:hypothetical protein [Clostridia bacterium]
MTIQISIIIWTILCFIALMLILHNWLFKPVLAVMDKRRERIEKAAARKAEAERLTAEHQQKLQEQKAAYAAEQKAQLKAEAEKIQSNSKKAVVEARHARLNEVEEYRQKMEQEQEEILTALKPYAKGFASAFAKRLISH